MDDQDISRMIDAELASYTYEKPEPGTTLGEPWSEDKVLSYIPKLRQALVPFALEIIPQLAGGGVRQ